MTRSEAERLALLQDRFGDFRGAQIALRWQRERDTNRGTTMTTEPSEREETAERLNQIRERWTGVPSVFGNDIDFLLSLLDSQMEFGKKFAEKTYVGQYETVNDAATRMRERCVDAIKSLRATPHGAAYNNAINDAIHKVESLTLEGTKKQ